MAEFVWRGAVDLACHDAGGVCDGLLEADGGGAAVVWCHVHVDPRDIDAGAVVDCHCAEECCEVVDRVGGDGEE